MYIEPNQDHEENGLSKNITEIKRLMNFLIFKIKFNVTEEHNDDNFCTPETHIYLLFNWILFIIKLEIRFNTIILKYIYTNFD